MKSVMYTLWLVFSGIYFLQGAVTGSLRKRRGLSADAVWPIQNWARLAHSELGETRVPFRCWFLRGSRSFCFVRAFPK
jgi:hypothetical protein